MSDLHTDPAREGHPNHHATGLYVRAMTQDSRWGSVNIAELDGPSLLSWLKSRGGDNQWAEDVVLILLGHKPEDARVREPSHG